MMNITTTYVYSKGLYSSMYTICSMIDITNTYTTIDHMRDKQIKSQNNM